MNCDVVGRISRFCLLSVAFLVIVSPAFAKNWADGTSTWNVAGNWSPAAVPIAGDAVNIVFTDGTARTVTYDAPTTPTLGAVSIDLTGAGTAASTLSLTNSSSNNLSTNGGFVVGGYNGTAVTAGRGAVIQSVGTATVQAGVDMALGHGAGSTGTYTLSGGALVANQSEYIGLSGTGTFNQQSAGMNTINSSAVGSFILGVNSTATGNYNLSGTGTLSVTAQEYVGYQGLGVFTQSGGTNSIVGSGHGLTLGNSATGSGTYTASGNAALNVAGDVTVGLNGAGTLNVQGNANVNITGALNIGAGDHVNLSGGTLRFNGYSRNATGVFNYTGGTLKLAPGPTGTRVITSDSGSSDPTITDIFGLGPTISAGKSLVLEGGLDVNDTVFVAGGALQIGSGAFSLRVGEGGTALLRVSGGGSVTADDAYIGGVNTNNSGTLTVDGPTSSFTTPFLFDVGPRGTGALNITNGGTVTSQSLVSLGDQLPGNFTVVLSGAGSKWMIHQGLAVGVNGTGTVDIQTGTLLSVDLAIAINSTSTVTLNGGTLGLNTLSDPNSRLIFNSGTFQLVGNRTVGVDSIVSRFYGSAAAVPIGKGLTIGGTATIASTSSLTISGGTFKSNGLTVASGGVLDFDRGVFELTGGVITGLTNLIVPTNGEFRASGVQPVRVTGAAGSTITATGALTLGDASAVNGFGTQGTLVVGANMVKLLDANDVVFDSLALATLGNGVSPGTLEAANGLTLDFGGNITGFGTVTTPNLLAKPLIANGHIAGTSAAQKITLSGYVKGAGTFDNVMFTGTFSPGFSPTISSAGAITLGSSNTLIMELGGTTPGSSYDQIQASGALGLGGILQISLINGFNPSAGQSFDLLDWGSISGTFASINLPTLSGLTWNTSQLYTTGIISVANTGLPGDFNHDGAVGAADYVVWRKGLGTIYSQSDYNVWRANFGAPSGSGAGASLAGSAVPEPGGIILFILAAVGSSAAWRRRATG